MIIFGKNTIMEALKSGKAVHKLWAANDRDNDLLALARKSNLRAQLVSRDKLDELANGGSHQGFVAEVEDFTYSSVEEILSFADSRGQQPFLVILDGVEDPHNLGSVLRVCECAGVHGIIIPKHRACEINETVAKTSAGALSYMRVAKVVNLNQTVDMLKSRGVWVFAVELGGQDIYSQNLTGALALVIGSEGHGVSPLLKKNCDGVLTLPMKGQVNSLNASVACGIAVFESLRQREGR